MRGRPLGRHDGFTIIANVAPFGIALFFVGATASLVEAQDTTIVADVSVVAMTSPTILTHRNVTIAGDRIVAIDSGAVPPRSSVRLIDGRRGYLVPGLTDAHVHLELGERRWLPVFLSYGITTVFNLRGEQRHLVLRADVAEGRVIGPTIYTAGQYANLPLIQTVADAERVAKEQKAAGYDFVKIHGNLSPDAYRALANETRRLGIPLIGHAPRNLPFDSLLANRQIMVAHAEELLYTHFRKPDTTGLGALGPRMREAGVWLTPNLVAYTLIARQIGRPAAIDSMLTLADSRFLDTAMVRLWRSGTYTNRPLDSAPAYETNRRFLFTVVDGLHRAGVPMLAGTDTPLPGIYPGRSLHDELDYLVDAGFSRYEALATATVLPGRFVDENVKRGTRFGTIEVGSRADVLLVDGNPLSDLSVLRAPRAVMVAGRWLERAELDRMLRR
jgi:imidazolonepropionase-like amidohydrolase